jgi:hypothetical protein
MDNGKVTRRTALIAGGAVALGAAGVAGYLAFTGKSEPEAGKPVPGEAGPALVPPSGALPAGKVGAAYSAAIPAPTGGKPPYTFSNVTGLPAGLSVDATGRITGTPTVPGTFTVTGTVQQTASFSLTLTVQPADAVKPADGGKPSLLTPGDFTYLGHYKLSSDMAADRGNIAIGFALAHRYVGGQLRFLITAPTNKGAWDLIEFALPRGGYGQTVSTRTNLWPSAAVWKDHGLNDHYGLWWEDLGQDGGRLWSSQGINYPGAGTSYLTEAISTRVLNADGTVSGWKGMFGFQGVGQRCISGRVQKNPAWFQTQYGVGPYLYGFGGSASRAGMQVSFGAFAVAGPDVTTYKPPSSYPPKGYADDGSDWCVPSSDFKVLADHTSGVTANGGKDWYDLYTGPGFVPGWDRGVRLNPVTNYYCGNNYRIVHASCTFTKDSATVKFGSPQTLNDGDWIGPLNGTAPTGLVGGPGQVVKGAVKDALTATLNSGFTAATITDTDFVVYVAPPKPPGHGGATRAQWTSPAPDGRNRFEEGALYGGSLNWIDGPSKYGIVAILSGAAGRAWYHVPGNYGGSDSGSSEIQIFDPADLGAVAQGRKKPWNVQPAAMKDITPDLRPTGICTGSHGYELNCACAASFDPTTRTLWVFSPFTGVGNNCVLSAYAVNC